MNSTVSASGFVNRPEHTEADQAVNLLARLTLDDAVFEKQFAIQVLKHQIPCDDYRHGELVDKQMYLADTVVGSATCQSLKVNVSHRCENGQWRQNQVGSYFESCQKLQDCAEGISHGTEIEKLFYRKPTAQECQRERIAVRCDDGQFLALDSGKIYTTCRQHCGTIEHNQTIERVLFDQEQVGTGEFCQSQTVRLSCQDGEVSSSNPRFRFPSCQVMRGCGDLNHGEKSTKVMYKVVRPENS